MTSIDNSLLSAIRSVADWAETQIFAQWELANFRTQRLLGETTIDELKQAFDPHEFDYDSAVRIVGVVLSRRARGADTGVLTTNGQRIGRILRHSLRETTYSCTTQDISGGFFDSQDLPPWDLWVAIHGGESAPTLLSWIPDILIERANAGTEASAEECFDWYELRMT
jgi:hypothetical protein